MNSGFRSLQCLLLALILIFSSMPVGAQLDDTPSAAPASTNPPNGSSPVPPLTPPANGTGNPQTNPASTSNSPELQTPEGPVSKLPDTSKDTAANSFGQVQQNTKGDVCEPAIKVSPEEAQKFLDVLKSGFVGSDINSGSGADPAKKRNELPTDSLILQDPEDPSIAAKAKVENKEIEPFEVSHYLNTSIKGPFAFGLVLDDTLRAGKCDAPDENCWLTGGRLKLRNSGKGIVADVKPIKDFLGGAYSKLKSQVTGEQYVDSKINFTSEEQASLATALVDSEDDGTPATIQSAKRIETDIIPNTILTQNFQANMATDCQDCIISTYSMFDKYFNQWMSSEMVISTFGPSLLYQSKKMFGWVGRRGLFPGIKHGIEDFRNKIAANLETPGSILGNIRLHSFHDKLDSHGWREWWQTATNGNADGSGYPMIKTTEFQTWWGEQTKHGGFLDKMTDPQERAEFVRVVKNGRAVARAIRYQYDKDFDAYKAVEKQLIGAGLNPLETPEGKEALINYGRSTAKFMNHIDDDLGLDAPEWAVHHVNTGLYDKGVKTNTGEIVDLYKEHRNFRIILQKFADSGDFRNFENEISLYKTTYETDGFGNLNLYGFDRKNFDVTSPPTPFRNVSFANIDRAYQGFNNVWAYTDYGELIPYNAATKDFLKTRQTGAMPIYQGNWAKIDKLTPENLAERITNARVGNNLEYLNKNFDQMYNTLREKNFTSRRYWNALDKLIAQEDEFVRSYFSVKGGLKWTLYPYGYWSAKSGFSNLGVGNTAEGFSFYQLPDTWTDVDIQPGSGNDKAYSNAFVDFFSNEGSDQGDLFVQVLNKLPWKLVYDSALENWKTGKDMIDKVTGNGLRNEVEDLAYYVTGPTDCANCTVNITATKSNSAAAQPNDFRPFFVVENYPLNSYMVEIPRSSEAKKKGQTLIAYTHHTDLIGKTNDIEGGGIILSEALEGKEEPKTCTDAVKSLPFYGAAKAVMPDFLLESKNIGGTLGAIESLTYFTFFWPGVFSSIALQFSYASKLQDCVDTEEGYFVHYFLPTKEEADKKDEGKKIELSTEKASDYLNNIKKQVIDGSFDIKENEADKNQSSPTKDAVKKIGDDITKFVSEAKENEIVQATLRTEGNVNSGQLKGTKLFYFWCGPGCERKPSEYKTTGKEIISSKDGNVFTIDYEKGDLLFNGKPVITNDDIARSGIQDLAGPFNEFPDTISITCMTPTKEVAIEINVNGEAFVRNSQALGCLQQGVMEQTGLPLQGNNLSAAFGLVDSIVTTTHPNIAPVPSQNQIIAEGIPRKVVQGPGSKVLILADLDVNLEGSPLVNAGNVGQLKSIQFKNGTILVKPDGCFITYLRHHENAILDQSQVKGLKPSLTTSTNPENMCEEPAIDFSVLGNPDSPKSQEEVQQFNKSLQKLGPFTVFETPTKRYMLYSERDSTGECKDHLRVIDKETGAITDYTGTAKQTPDGIEFTTDDGNKHNLAFNADNGIPTIQFDNNPPETLLNAQGRNGSFYYDPEKGLWYADNGHLLPLLEAFRDGIATKVGPDNTVSSSASGNTLNLNVGQGGGGLLDLPSLPTNPLLLLVFISAIAVAFVYIRRRNEIADGANNF